MNESLNRILDGYREEMVSVLRELLRIRSVIGEAREDAPYGAEIGRAFSYAMELGRRKGFSCVNYENRAGEMNFGDGEEAVGVVAHLDVVPEGDGWSVDPYGGEVKDGVIYGRGAVDDKGCFVAAFYACLALKESGLPLSKRVKQIVGTNEETGTFPCIQYYKAHTDDMPVCGIVPDSWFPAAYAEKGMLNYRFSRRFSEAEAAAGTAVGVNAETAVGAGIEAVGAGTASTEKMAGGGAVRLLSLAGGEALNVVAPEASAELAVSPQGAAAVRAAVAGYAEREQITLKEDPGRLTLTATGKAAHASAPELGVNAIAALLRLLAGIDFETAALAHTVSVLARQIGDDTDGTGLGIACADHTGALTNNAGLLSFDGETLQLGMNLRSPVSEPPEALAGKLAAAAEAAGMESEILAYNPHFYMEPDSELITTLVSVYQDMTGDLDSKPVAHGGGSYARILKNFVPFGPAFQDEELPFHQQDEHITCERLLLLSKIYAQALYRLAK